MAITEAQQTLERRDESSTKNRQTRWRLNIMSVVIGLIALVGLLVFMYPPTAAWWSSYNQSLVIRENNELAARDVAPGNAVRLEEARRYNQMLSSGQITVDGTSNKPTSAGSDMETDLIYDDLLAGPGGFMARVKIPSVNIDLPVYHGTSDAVLLKGAGHLQGTSLPVGGTDTHSVLSAHTGLASATMFNDLDKVEIGDTFVIEVLNEVLTYQVIETKVVEPDDTETILPRPGQDIVTLITCTPLGINSHRILVTGERITPTPIADIEAAGAAPEIPGFPWWAVIITGGVAVVGVYVWRSGYPQKPKASRSGRLPQPDLS